MANSHPEEPPATPLTAEHITAERNMLFDELAANISGQIREYTAAQAPLWRQFPFLATLADGKTGYSTQNRFLYEYGLWKVAGTAESGALSDYVDCDNGNIIHVARLDQIDFNNTTSDHRLFSIWGDGDKFDAGLQLEKIQQKAVMPIPDFYADREREWHRRRARIVEQFGLLTVYQRLKPDSAEA